MTGTFAYYIIFFSYAVFLHRTIRLHTFNGLCAGQVRRYMLPALISLVSIRKNDAIIEPSDFCINGILHT